VLVLGVAYKPDINDARESPALDVIGLLRRRGARVAYSDPHIPMIEVFGESLASDVLTAKRLEATDCVVIVTNHQAFDYALVARHSKLIVDTRNALRGVPPGDAVIVPL
jgi:UDP-N-acetyl-D-glucosamine dehydrogenase